MVDKLCFFSNSLLLFLQSYSLFLYHIELIIESLAN